MTRARPAASNGSTGNAFPQLSPGWVWATVAELASGINPGFPSGKHNSEGHGVPHLRPMNINVHGEIDLTQLKYVEVEACDRLESGDVLFNNTNSPELVGKTACVRQDTQWAYSNHMTRIRLNKVLLDPQWVALALHYSFARGVFRANCAHHVNQASINSTFLANSIKIPLAPLSEQHRIVARIEELFTELDAGVASLNRAQANLKRYRASVLKAACEGHLVPQAPSDEPASELLKRMLAERRAKWEAEQLTKRQAAGVTPKDSGWTAQYSEPDAPDVDELPGLPSGWCWATWEQMGLSQNGRSFPSAEYQSDGVKLLRPGNLHSSGSVVWEKHNTRYLPESWATRFPDFVVGPRELVMNLTAQSLKDEFLGRICLTGPSERCMLNQRIARLTPLGISPRYLLYVFKSAWFRRFVDGLNTGSLIQHMFTSQLANLILPLAPVAEQHRIVAEVERHLAVAEEMEKAIAGSLARAERLRQSILKAAFQGKLVPQDPNDEPAEMLLERIKREKAERETKATTPKSRRTQVKRTYARQLELI